MKLIRNSEDLIITCDDCTLEDCDYIIIKNDAQIASYIHIIIARMHRYNAEQTRRNE